MSAHVSESASTYTDRKRYLWAFSILWPLTPAIFVWLAIATGNGLYYAGTLVFWYVIVPLIDHVFAEDASNPPEAEVQRLEADTYYKWLTYLAVPNHFITLFVSAWAVATQSLNIWEFLALALSVGIVNGLAINTGHELGHKPNRLDNWMAKIVLSVVGYGHFVIEHNRGHHKDVATPDDPASSRFGESIYKFALREIPGGWTRAWRHEVARLARRGERTWSLHNEILQPLAMTLILYGALLALFGPVMIPFLAIQLAFGWWQLTSANYVEHYGLLRLKGADGRYERCRPEHSWNSNRVYSNLLLFHLQRHSDHHANPIRSYQCLRNFEGVPTLPSGYPLMFFISYIPPLWRYVMDHRVLANVGGDFTKVNADPDYVKAS